MGDVNELETERNKTMANLPGSIKNLNTLLGEQLAEGGGGGGGDFTTAYVTINTNNQAAMQYIVPYIMSSGDIENLITAQGRINAGETQTITAVLGRGGCSFFCQGSIYSVSGNARMMDSRSALITGDCTITIS